jgi:hypothetical protein
MCAPERPKLVEAMGLATVLVPKILEEPNYRHLNSNVDQDMNQYGL